MQLSSVQGNAVHYSRVYYLQWFSVHSNAVKCSTIQFNAVQFSDASLDGAGPEGYQAICPGGKFAALFKQDGIDTMVKRPSSSTTV